MQRSSSRKEFGLFEDLKCGSGAGGKGMKETWARDVCYQKGKAGICLINGKCSFKCWSFPVLISLFC